MSTDAVLRDIEPHRSELLGQMEKLANVPLTIRAELDQTTLTFGEILDLQAGSVIRLPRSTGENIDVYAENVLIGWGEVLMVEGALTIRLADLRNAHLPGLQEQEAAGTTPAQKGFTDGGVE